MFPVTKACSSHLIVVALVIVLFAVWSEAWMERL